MKAWRASQFGNPSEILKLTEIDAPSPPPGFVIIKVAAAGVALPDVLMLKGQYPLVKKPPVSPGMEVAGEIVGLGNGVTTFSLGDRVMTT